MLGLNIDFIKTGSCFKLCHETLIDIHVNMHYLIRSMVQCMPVRPCEARTDYDTRKCREKTFCMLLSVGLGYIFFGKNAPKRQN